MSDNMVGFNTWRCSCGVTGPGGAEELAEHWRANGHDPNTPPIAASCIYCGFTSRKFGELREQVRTLGAALNRIQHQVRADDEMRLTRIRDVAREALVEAHVEVWT